MNILKAGVLTAHRVVAVSQGCAGRGGTGRSGQGGAEQGGAEQALLVSLHSAALYCTLLHKWESVTRRGRAAGGRSASIRRCRMPTPTATPSPTHLFPFPSAAMRWRCRQRRAGLGWAACCQSRRTSCAVGGREGGRAGGWEGGWCGRAGERAGGWVGRRVGGRAGRRARPLRDAARSQTGFWRAALPCALPRAPRCSSSAPTTTKWPPPPSHSPGSLLIFLLCVPSFRPSPTQPASAGMVGGTGPQEFREEPAASRPPRLTTPTATPTLPCSCPPPPAPAPPPGRRGQRHRLISRPRAPSEHPFLNTSLGSQPPPPPNAPPSPLPPLRPLAGVVNGID